MTQDQKATQASKKQTDTGKRKPPNAGKGRPKGSKNRLTNTLKEAIEKSFDEVGGVQYLVEQARENPTAYMSLLAKVLPQQINAQVATKTLPASVDEFV